jgi:hypothetical protein
MRIPSLSWVVTGKAWLAAALSALTKGELWAETSVILPYFREQNSG